MNKALIWIIIIVIALIAIIAIVRKDASTSDGAPTGPESNPATQGVDIDAGGDEAVFDGLDTYTGSID